MYFIRTHHWKTFLSKNVKGSLSLKQIFFTFNAAAKLTLRLKIGREGSNPDVTNVFQKGSKNGIVLKKKTLIFHSLINCGKYMYWM